jgi:D-glycero-D-manno-heptose 1,7-bisphosphate phosphatase
MKQAIFLERDGVLNRVRAGTKHQSPVSMTEFQINADARPVLDQFKSLGYLLLVTTNQPGVSQGVLSRRDLDYMHQMLRRSLPVDDIFVCPHDESDHCPCRKPKPGLLTEAAFKWHLDLDHSFVVSDKWQDAEAAQLAGCTSLLIKSPWNGNGHHDYICSDLNDVLNKILQFHAGALRCVA